MVRPKKTPTARNRSSAAETQVTLNESSSLGVDEEEPAQLVAVSTRAARANQKAAAAVKAKTKKTIATSDAEPPRTRRMASLNAEFLVHYCSSSNHVSSNALNTTQASNNLEARKSGNSIVHTKKNKLNGNKRNKTTRTPNKTVCQSSDSNSEHELTIDYSKMQTKANQIEQIGIENYANILNDFAVQEDDNEAAHTEEDKEHNNDDQVEEEHDDEYVENLKKRKGVKRKPAVKTKQPPPVRKQPAAKLKKAKKPQITPSETSDDGETPLKKVAVEEPPSGRPKREAGLRASAMIIQTNEIEKTKFQYNYTSSSSESKQPVESPPPKLKSTSFNNFQIPAPSPKPQLNKKTSQMLKQISSTSTMLALSLPPACPIGEDDSSNDILIIDTPKSTQYASKSASASKSGEPHLPTLTEELIIEHNKLHGSVGCGSGTFSTFTRDYITKWTLAYEPTEEKPFAAGLIPIESFGVKVLNEPQYLQNKSRLGGGGGAAATTGPPPPVSIAKVALNQTLNQKVKKEDSPKQICCQQQQQQQHQQSNSTTPKAFTTNNSNSNENLNSLDNKLSLLNDLKRTAELSSILVNTNLKVAAKVNDTSNHNNNNNTNNTDSSSSDNNIASGLNYFPTKCIPA